MWFQRLSDVIGYIDSEYHIVPKILVNYCYCLQQKVNKLIVLLEMCFQRSSGVIGYIDSEYDSVNNI